MSNNWSYLLGTEAWVEQPTQNTFSKYININKFYKMEI